MLRSSYVIIIQQFIYLGGEKVMLHGSFVLSGKKKMMLHRLIVLKRDLPNGNFTSHGNNHDKAL